MYSQLPALILLLCLTAIFDLQAQDKAPFHQIDQQAAFRSLEFDSVRALSEINIIGEADAYPWISGDGLRIYYTKGASTAGNKFFMAKRADLNSEFDTPELIELPSFFDPFNVNSCWLTPDELEFYFIAYGLVDFEEHLFKLTRNNTSENFGNQQEISLEGFSKVFFISPSLTPDKSELYLYQQDTFFVFEQMTDDSYTLSDFITDTGTSTLVPGKLSSDGLKYYFNKREQGVFGSRLYSLSRPDLQSSFDIALAEEMDEIVYEESTYNGQPTLTPDEGIMVFVRSVSDSWQENQLFIATNSIILDVVELSDSPLLYVSAPYPNPVRSDFDIRYKVLESVDQAKLLFYSMDGKFLFENAIDPLNDRIRLSADDLSPGVYFYHIMTAEGISNSQKLIVQK